MIELEQLARILDIEYHDLLAGSSQIYHDKIRAHLLDGSFVDVWFSKKIPGRFSYHWERRHLDGTIYRHDNFPDPRWKEISSFPKHFTIVRKRESVKAPLMMTPLRVYGNL